MVLCDNKNNFYDFIVWYLNKEVFITKIHKKKTSKYKIYKRLHKFVCRVV